ncbi:MAG TPA: hypothetical protein VHH52_01195 [Pseudonocardiaceae bacterium]|nr:hypothetical protein [Pseudonocardiaceae bacterium]
MPDDSLAVTEEPLGPTLAGASAHLAWVSRVLLRIVRVRYGR